MRVLLVLLVLVVGCNSKVSKEDLTNLNGYWEIEKVTFANGDTRDFMPSTTIDYLELNGMEGFRKKVQPKFNGTFETSNDAEYFSIEEKEGDLKIHYTADKHSREALISVSKTNFSVVDNDTITYTYKRYEPMNLNP